MIVGTKIRPVPSARRIPLALAAFGVVAVASVWLGFLAFNPGQSRVLIKWYGYYTIAATFAWALIALVRVRLPMRDEIVNIVPRERWQAAAVIGACALVALLTTPVTYKVLYDEMVLQATAFDMRFLREMSTIVRGYRVDGVFVPFDSYVDKRPGFFPFLLSLIHDASGYREANAFYLNLALAPALLAQVYVLARRLAAHGGAMVAMIALGTLSLFAENATGAGMELLNLVMLLATMQLAVLYLDAPDGPRLSALVLFAVLLAQTRYESSLFVVPTAVVALEGWRRARRVLLPPAALLAPLLLVPYAIQNTYVSGTPLLWDLRANDTTRFGWQYVAANLRHACAYLFGTSDMGTNSLWLSVAGSCALGLGVFVVIRNIRRWREAPAIGVVACAFGAGVLCNLALLMFYYWGQLDDPIVGRLSLPFQVLLALVLARAVQAFDRPRRHLAWIAAGVSVFGYFCTGLVANAQFSGLNVLDRELLWERRFVAGQPPGDVLVVTSNSALPWILQRMPAVGIDQARRRAAQLEYQLEHRAFRIYVFQDYRPTDAAGDFQLVPGDRLPDWFVLEPIRDKRFGAHLERVSRLVSIRRPPATEKGR